MTDNPRYDQWEHWSSERDRLERRCEEKRAFMKLAEQKQNDAGEEFLEASRKLTQFIISHPEPVQPTGSGEAS